MEYTFSNSVLISWC